MTFACKNLTRRNNNAVLIAICCSYPWLFPSSSAHHSSHPIAATVAALALVLVATLAATYLCRKHRTAA